MRRICVLGVSVGGQGGQTFGDWLCIATETAGHRAIARSKPMVAQRGGSVDFYAELYFNEGAKALPPPIFSPEPVKGNIDLLVGMELLEFARAVHEGYPAPNCRALANTARWLTTEEKLPLRQPLLTWQLAKEFVQRRFPEGIFFNATLLARKNGLPDIATNAILFGALAASGFLPLPKEAFEIALRRGEGTEANLRAFELGYRYVAEGKDRRSDEEEPPAWFERLLPPFETLKLPDELKGFVEGATQKDEELGFLLREACRQLADYQDDAYAAEYLRRVKTFFSRDTAERNWRLTKEIARVLALRMSYEDAARVAQEKLRPERLAWLLGGPLRKGQIVKLYEVLGPDLEEIYGLFPAKLVSPLVRRLGWEEKPTGITMTMTLETTSLWGNLLLRLLLPFRKFRRASYRFHKEWGFIEEWLRAVQKFSDWDYDLGLMVAEAGELVRGYGHTRHRSLKVWTLFRNALEEMVQKGKDPSSVKTIARRFLDIYFESPDGLERARAFGEHLLRTL